MFLQRDTQPSILIPVTQWDRAACGKMKGVQVQTNKQKKNRLQNPEVLKEEP